jgi:hypothetical protein
MSYWYTKGDCSGEPTGIDYSGVSGGYDTTTHKPFFDTSKGCVLDSDGGYTDSAVYPYYVKMSITTAPPAAAAATDLKLLGLIALIALVPIAGAAYYFLVVKAAASAVPAPVPTTDPETPNSSSELVPVATA